MGIVSLILGGGRETKESEIDLSVGLVLRKKVGDYVNAGESLAVIHANDPEKLRQAKERVCNTYHFSEESVERPAFIKAVITGNQ